MMRAPNLAPGRADLAGPCLGGACPCDHSSPCELCGDPIDLDDVIDTGTRELSVCRACAEDWRDGRIDADDLEEVA